MSKQVKLSELSPYAYIGHDGDVITKEKAMDLLMQGKAGAMVAVGDGYIQDVLDQVQNDVKNGIEKDYYSSDVPCKRIVVDYLPGRIRFKGDDSDNIDYHDLTKDKTYKVFYGDSMDVDIFKESGIVVVIDDAGYQHEILIGDYDILSLVIEEEVKKNYG
ncbi:hypothetical protein Slash_4 [Bacillus phage Slash]|uniref:Uncharacterized protein n=2 Tax=Slashvirus TaxID=1921709 RepID=U5Q096_9CAUD|nr:hypothetical protein Staley_4 [Bacillus phage Staley]YP_008771906.1 hypothetical protein Slash_4 [Bacillus phage Slash]AGY48293.1 hypothetical protein Slash_4 [Bacillus phage Slash]AGY48687.1 hypothetical protein Staley_4 [Bacillus phage Staley]